MSRMQTIFAWRWAVWVGVVSFTISPAIGPAEEETPMAPAPASADSGTASSTEPAPRPTAVPRPGLRPYAVAVALKFPADPQWTPAWRRRLVRETNEQLSGGAGALWSPLQVEEAEPPLGLVPTADDRPARERLISTLELRTEDKVFLLELGSSGGEFVVRGLEWDRNSATFGPPRENVVTDARLLSATIVDLVAETFRPLSFVRSAAGTEAVVEMWGGELSPPDPRFLPARAGDALLPYIRFLDRDRQPERRQFLPWTYLQVGAIDRSRGKCRIVSTFAAPLTVGRRRIELMALRCSTAYSNTTLQIAPHGNPQDPVVGARVEILDRVPTPEDKVEDRVVVTSNRFGEVQVSADAAKPIRWVHVYSGSILLARVPVVAGLERHMVLPVPDDTARLTVEGELSLLEGELIDAVGRREVFMARARQLSREDKWDDIERLTGQIEDLPGIADFELRAEAVRVRGIQTARDQRNKLGEARINKLVTTFLILVKEHLDPEKIAGFKDEMAELKRAK